MKIKKAEVRRQKAEGDPTHKCEGFDKVCTLLFFDLLKSRGCLTVWQSTEDFYLYKSLQAFLLPSALCPLPFFGKSLMLIANSTQLCSLSGKTTVFQGFQEIIQGIKKPHPA
jgi:hypothetical protein